MRRREKRSRPASARWDTMPTETTCQAKAVDGIARGAFIGLLWGVLAPTKGRSRAASALSAAVDVAGLVGLYCGLQCRFERAAGVVGSEAVAGAVSGAWYGARVSKNPRTVLGCSVALAGAGVAKGFVLPG
jgi:hypothetical protein